MKCPLCGAENSATATKCYLCNFRLQQGKPSPKEQFRRRSEFYPSGQTMLPHIKGQTPIYAGGLLLFVALLDFLGILVSNVYIGYYAPGLRELMFYSSLFVGFLALLTTVGGFMAIFRRYWTACLVFSIITVVMHLLAGAILRLMLSVAALVFVMLAKDEFD